MKFTIIILVFCIIEASSYENITETEFEEKKHMLSDDKSRQIQAEALEKAKKEINTQNAEYEKGNASFAEKLNDFSNVPKVEFEKTMEGLTMPKGEAKPLVGDRFNGLIEPSEEIKNDPTNRAKLEEAYDELDRSATPTTFDARSIDFITPVKNQGTCGACSAFAATALHETCMKRVGATDDDLDLSEQYLIDCGYNGKSMNGCNGAHPHAYTQFLATNGGNSPHEFSYPYLERDPKLTCPSNLKIWNSGAKVTDQIYDYECNADKMKKLVAEYGAVLGGLYASDRGFMNYAKGVFNGCSKIQVNHAVLITGYGRDNDTGKDYWIIKNSWGTSWGEKGFAKIERGVNACGIEKLCVVAKCSKKEVAEAAPTKPTPKPIPASLKCDVTNLYGPDVNGRYTLTLKRGDSIFRSKVRCKKSICVPLQPGPKNACRYICGRTKC